MECVNIFKVYDDVCISQDLFIGREKWNMQSNCSMGVGWITKQSGHIPCDAIKWSVWVQSAASLPCLSSVLPFSLLYPLPCPENITLKNKCIMGSGANIFGPILKYLYLIWLSQVCKLFFLFWGAIINH